MTLFILILGLGFGSAVAWWVTRSFETARVRAQIHEMESKMRYAYGEAASLREKMASMQGQLGEARRGLEDEKIRSTKTVLDLTHSFRRGLLFLGTAAFAIGMTLGGGVSWVTANIQASGKYALEKADMQMSTALASVRAETLEKRVQDLQGRLDQSQQALLASREAKAIAETKLGVLLNSLAPQRTSQGFVVDYKELQDNLKNKTESKNAKGGDLPLLRSVPMYL